MTNKSGRRRLSMVVGFVTAACAVAVAPDARADEARGAVDWSRIVVRLDRFVRTGSETPREQLAATVRTRSEAPPAPSSDLNQQNPGNAWFGVAPRVAFVARDWASAYRLAGDRLSLVDAMRLSASTRMVMTRVRFGNGRITPFVQLGLGQWRTDRNILPLTPRTMELAGQLGGGVELRLAKEWLLACESSFTGLYEESRDANSLPQSSLWGVMVASRVPF